MFNRTTTIVRDRYLNTYEMCGIIGFCLYAADSKGRMYQFATTIPARCGTREAVAITNDRGLPMTWDQVQRGQYR